MMLNAKCLAQAETVCLQLPGPGTPSARSRQEFFTLIVIGRHTESPRIAALLTRFTVLLSYLITTQRDQLALTVLASSLIGSEFFLETLA